MKGFVQIFVAAVIPAVLSFTWHWNAGSLPPPKEAVERVSVEHLSPGEEILWVDARPEPEFLAGHVPGAVNLREEEWSLGLPAIFDRWQPGRRVVIYCGSQSCEASEAVARRLIRETGWANVSVLEGGWEAWRKQSQE